MKWYLRGLRKYAVFSGRASRKEFWMFNLFNNLIWFAIAFLSGVFVGFIGAYTLTRLYTLAVLIPDFAVPVRRLHDTGRSSWWLLIGFIPFIWFCYKVDTFWWSLIGFIPLLIGAIALSIFFVLDSTKGNNKYGANSKSVWC